jgi:hypothetical protein
LKARFFLVIRQAETSKIWGQIRSLLTDIILLTNSIMFNFDFVCRNRKAAWLNGNVNSKQMKLNNNKSMYHQAKWLKL